MKTVVHEWLDVSFLIVALIQNGWTCWAFSMKVDPASSLL
jgi:hypothetical protein